MIDQVFMGRKYKQLNQTERDLIGMLQAQGKSLREISKELGRDVSTIGRELKRNCHKEYGYLPHHAHEQAVHRRSGSRRCGRLRNEEVRAYVEEKLRLKWSPELISGRLKKEDPEKSISHEAIYQWVYEEAPEHIVNLAWSRHKRRKRGKGMKRRLNHIPHRVSIMKRPWQVDLRREAGHWEVDVALSRKGRAVLHILTERKTRYTKLTLLPNKTAMAVRDATISRLRYVPHWLRKTLTYDNGPENAGHIRVNDHLGTKSYFCRPFHSWEKGTVENTVGLVRRFFPKDVDLNHISIYKIVALEKWLNGRPRKCLNFQTPYEAFKTERCTY